MPKIIAEVLRRIHKWVEETELQRIKFLGLDAISRGIWNRIWIWACACECARWPVSVESIGVSSHLFTEDHQHTSPVPEPSEKKEASVLKKVMICDW
jgi:hypothetical protein